ncbi:AhpC/TSA family protein [Aspergillus parasiticus SU-1]|uniref:thioredoxin-dependent peroxiredoxin n=3 Tax=Aspergillus subgen. Circumdati TaxID=2720871 RepID=A0A5N6D430_ASPPA|nr:thioredoxin-like protein [Aspergillus parasiticus]KAE8307423.1 thioredoxin-like protein [Aspergillus transmontanensis]KJK67074.1 AhpC/TSA family protein [Aspergillus parasiticus SU-1]
MVELRKRKAPTQLPVAEKRTRKGQRSTTIPKGVLQENESSTVSEGVLEVGNKIILDGFGGEIETNDGIKTTLNKLVNESKSGVVLFTYPRASTPGCTKQACMFRDNYDYLTSTGFSIYGLSADSPRANTTFKAKQSLPYPLLCDTTSSLIAALGFKKAPKGTTRGIFAVDKEGTVLLLQPGGPDATVEAMRQLIARNSSSSSSESGI